MDFHILLFKPIYVLILFIFYHFCEYIAVEILLFFSQ